MREFRVHHRRCQHDGQRVHGAKHKRPVMVRGGAVHGRRDMQNAAEEQAGRQAGEELVHAGGREVGGVLEDLLVVLLHALEGGHDGGQQQQAKEDHGAPALALDMHACA